MDSVMLVGERPAVADSLNVVESEPLDAIPADVIEDLQRGVRRETPPSPKQRPRAPLRLQLQPSRNPWSIQSENDEEEEEEEEEEAGSASGLIGDMPLSDTVEYARMVFPLNDNDWIDPKSGLYLSGMTLD
eukprot:8344574-Heterocapsa_arctica.AAC.1